MPYLRPSLKSTIFLLFICLNNGLFAQSNFYKFTVGAGYGINSTFPDGDTQFDFSAYGSLDYNLTPYVILGTELQKGKLTGGKGVTEFWNNYSTMTFNAKVHAGEFMSARDLNNPIFRAFRGLYAAVGVGIVKNNVVGNKKPRTPKSKEVIFPFNAGINFYFHNHWGYSRFILNLNMQATTSLEDGMDGDLNQGSNFNDIYNLFSVGLKYNFGPLGLDRKR